MNKLIFVVGVMLLACTTLTQAAADASLIAGKTYYIHRQASGGDVFIKEQVPTWDFRNAFYVKVAKPIGNLKAGDSCFFVDGAKVKVRGNTEYGYLVKYVVGQNTKEACPNGTLAYVDGVPLWSFKSVPKQSAAGLEREADKILSNTQNK